MSRYAYLLDASNTTLGPACADAGWQLKAHLREKRIALTEAGGPRRRAHRIPSREKGAK